MWPREQVDIIAISWAGPFSPRDANAKSGSGVYQIYGTHAVGGPNSLLYIGRTKDFGRRTSSHANEWINWDAGLSEIYFGNIVSSDRQELNDEDLIARVEQLLIYYCTPAYNSNYIAKLDDKIPATAILNYGKHNRLPSVVSNLIDKEKFYSSAIVALTKID